MSGSRAMGIKRFRMTVDISMVILLPVLMGYSLVGETAHEVIGMIMGVLFAVHITLNRRWFAAIFRGKYDLRRIVVTALNISLLLCVITSMVSGIMLSKHLFSFLNVRGGAAFMRTLHLLAGYWGFALMSLHAGTHGGVMLKRGRRIRAAIYIPLICTALYGVFAFIRRGFYMYMFLLNSFVFFDTTEPFIWFYLDYLAVMLMFMVMGYLLVKMISVKHKRK